MDSNNTKLDQNLSNQILAPKWEEEAQSPAIVSQIQQQRDELQSSPFIKQNTPIMRVSQLDANRLDTEINVMLNSQFMKIFDFFKVSHHRFWECNLLSAFSCRIHEAWTHGCIGLDNLQIIHLLFGFYLRKYVTKSQIRWRKVQIPLLCFNLFISFSPLSRNQKIAYGALSIGGSWLWARISALISSGGAWGMYLHIMQYVWTILTRYRKWKKCQIMENHEQTRNSIQSVITC